VKQGFGISAVTVAVVEAAGATAGALCGVLLATALVPVSGDPAFTKGSSSVVAEGVRAGAAADT